MCTRSFAVQVDEEAKREAALPNDQPISLRRIFLGGIPAELEQLSNRGNVPFQGCIWNLMVNAVYVKHRETESRGISSSSLSECLCTLCLLCDPSTLWRGSDITRWIWEESASVFHCITTRLQYIYVLTQAGQLKQEIVPMTSFQLKSSNRAVQRHKHIHNSNYTPRLSARLCLPLLVWPVSPPPPERCNFLLNAHLSAPERESEITSHSRCAESFREGLQNKFLSN